MMGSHRGLIYTALLAAVLLGLGDAVPQAYALAKGSREYKNGQKAEVRKDYDEALHWFDEALKLDPANAQYMLAAERARFQAAAAHVSRGHVYLDRGNPQQALAEFEKAASIDPSNDAARQGIRQARSILEPEKVPPGAPGGGQAAAPPPAAQEEPKLAEALGPPVLKPLSTAPINLRMTNDAKVVFETIGKLAGINVLFDPDVLPTFKRITVELNNVSLEEALNQTALVTKTFWKPITSNAILVVQDTAVKRREQEEQVIKTFYLSNPITPQELTEAVTAIRSLLETRRIQQINSLNAIIIRDTPDKVAIAEKIIRDIDKAKPEVVVDVAVIEARRDKSRQLGIYPVSGQTTGIQSTATFSPPGTTTPSTGTTGTTATTTATAGSIGLNKLGSLSTSDWSITLPGATATAILGDSTTKILQRPEVRASNGQKATLKIGDRVPVATGSFSSGIGAVAGAGVSPLVNTQFQYIDVGVNLDITPTVHANNEITLKLRVEVSQVTSQANIGGIQQPVIGQRIVDHEIRLREGEVNILGGLLQTQVTKSVNGVPGFSQIPLLKYLFSNVSDTLAQDEVFIIMTPHTVRVPDILAANRRTLDVGIEGDVHLRTARSQPDAIPTPAAGSPAPTPAPAASSPSPAPSPIPPPPTAASPIPSAAASPAPAPAASTPDGSAVPRMRFEDPNLSPKSGETFRVPVRVENAREVASAVIQVSYDAAAMKLVQVTNGGLLNMDGQPVAVVQRTDEQSGSTTVTLTRPPGSARVAGSGVLAVLTFEAQKPGQTRLAVTPIGSRRGPQEAFPTEGAQATVTIR